MKFEAVITVWSGGIFQFRRRVEADHLEELSEKVDEMIEQVQIKIDKLIEERNRIADDDDIPF